jgi:hypothetical protein
VKGTGRSIPRDIVNISAEKYISLRYLTTFSNRGYQIYSSERDMEIIMNHGWARGLRKAIVSCLVIISWDTFYEAEQTQIQLLYNKRVLSSEA